MARCPKCGGDEYITKYIYETDYEDDIMIAVVRVQCETCKRNYTVREHFKLIDTENAQKTNTRSFSTGRLVRILVQRKVLTKFKIIAIIRYQKKGD